jgi:hypothetical protein
VFNFSSYVYLRYVLLISVIAALVPSASAKGRANDPLIRATWWKVDQHSAILVVALAGIFGSVLVSAATRKNFRAWWVFVGCGVFAGDFPATFYLAAAPGDATLPLTEMYTVGTVCGVVVGIVLNALLGSRKPNTPA